MTKQSSTEATTILPVSAVVATRNRADALRRTLESLSKQAVLPSELIVVDGSDNAVARSVVEAFATESSQRCRVLWQAAAKLGAAAQRNQGSLLSSQPFLWFFDDDILFEPQCVPRLWAAIGSDPKMGGVNAMISNQRYMAPGSVSRAMFTILSGKRSDSFAGKVFGPAINLLPEDRADLPDVVPVQWLNTTCVLYRKEALPWPPFDSVFTGYSMMEDLTLSLKVGRHMGLGNARTARIIHDSQPGDHKRDIAALAEMELANRHYVMTEVLNRRSVFHYTQLVVWEAFQVASCAARCQVGPLFSTLKGKWNAARSIVRGSEDDQ